MFSFAFVCRAIVDTRLERSDFAVALEDRNERDEVARLPGDRSENIFRTSVDGLPSLQAIFVQIVRLPIACGNDNHSIVEEFCEESFEDHCVGDVSDLELIEADQPRVVLDQLCDRRNWIERLGLRRRVVADLQIFDFVNLFVNFGHERIEVNALLLRDLKIDANENVTTF
jgi:hypothetical protein